MRTDWLCLDLPKTVGWEARDREDDALVDYDALVAWGQGRGCVDALTARELLNEAGCRPREAKRAWQRAIQARSLLYRVFRRVADGERPGDGELEALNELLARAASERLLETRDDDFEWGWRRDEDRLDTILNRVAWSAAELLTSQEKSRVRCCASDTCGWLFIDASRNRSRRWCDMSECGNLEKARRFRERGAND